MHRTVIGLALAIGLVAASSAGATAQVYGYNSPLPSGSYQQSCVNAQMRGTTLSASCATPNGQQVYSSLNVSRCNGDIANTNGRLTCAGYNNGGYNNGGYSNRGGNDDDDDNGNGRGRNHEKRHHHPKGNAYGYYNNGPGSRNGGYNNGGYNNGGYGYGLPGGTYQQSCTNARMNGSVLSASCTAVNGNWINSSLDVRRCSQGNDIYNRNGYLGC